LAQRILSPLRLPFRHPGKTDQKIIKQTPGGDEAEKIEKRQKKRKGMKKEKPAV
jgi:hypothetical protein